MKLSIIIPAYNAEDTLKEAVLSAFNSFAEQEIIIINDGSVDSTKNICDKLANEYSNIKVIHKTNGGVSKARNIGIEKATGEYIMFMDADDRLIYDCTVDIEEVLKESDMLLFSFNERTMNGHLLNTYIFEDKVINKTDIANCFIDNKYSFSGPWAKIYKKDIILKNGLKFNEGQKYGEDTVFVLFYISCLENSIRLASNVFYTHYINPKGASFFDKYYNKMNVYLFNLLKAFERLIINSNSKNIELLRDFACMLFNDAIIHYYTRNSKSVFRDKYIETYNLFKSFLSIKYLRNYNFFKWLRKNEIDISKKEIIEKLYKRNLLYKIKYKIKKIVLLMSK